MQLYDDPTTVATAPALPAAGTPGYFTDGVPGSVGRTLVRAWWLNLIAQELVNVVTGAGLTPSRSTTHQVLNAIQALIASAISPLATTIQVNAETTRAEGAELTLSMAISAETTNRSAAIAAETTRAESAESTLSMAISAETTNRSAAIAAETTRAENAEATLNPKLVGNWSSAAGPWWIWDPTTGLVRVCGNLIQNITSEGEITLNFPVNIGTYRTGRAGTLNSTASNQGSAVAQPVSGSATSMVVMINDSQTGGAAYATGVWFEAEGYSSTQPTVI